MAKWGTTAKVAASAFALICVHAIVRDTIASSTADKAEETLLVLGKNVAGLPKPSDAAIQKHVDRDKKMIKARETLAALDGFDSSLDLLTRISQSVPSVDGGSKVEMNVSSFDVDNEDVFIQGTIDSKHRANLKNWLQKAAKPGSVKEASVQGPVPKGFFGAPFAYVMKASRIQ